MSLKIFVELFPTGYRINRIIIKLVEKIKASSGTLQEFVSVILE